MREALNITLPSKPWLLWAGAMLLWISHPILYTKYLIITQDLGWYPPEADSIGIPMLGMMMFSFFGFPFWVILCLRVFRMYPRSARLLEWSNQRQGYSLKITLIFGLLVMMNIWDGIGYLRLYCEMRTSDLADVSVFAICMAIGSGGWATIWLAMRSCLIAKKKTEPVVVGR
jgi:hypothetical protein